MAIHPKLHPSPGHLTPQQVHQISSWTEQAAETVHVSAVGNSSGEGSVNIGNPQEIPLAIPLDGARFPSDSPLPIRVRSVRAPAQDNDGIPIASTTYRRREPIHRDSLKRRDALLKGKEGSRRRQRWENDRLLNNPWAQTPSANDWQILPTHTRHNTVPYYLAHLWDNHLVAKDHRQSSKSKGHTNARSDNVVDNRDHISKELRLRLKHARAARGLLQDLEEDIRQFVQKWDEKQELLQQEGLADAPSPLSDDDGDSKNNTKEDDDNDEDEDEIVFVGRNGQMHDSPERKRRFKKLKEDMGISKERDGEKLVFESLEEDRAAGFGRWIVHSLAAYYGLRTWSVTVGSPPRREAYVGIDHSQLERRKQHSRPSAQTRVSTGHRASDIQGADMLPRPLWVSI